MEFVHDFLEIWRKFMDSLTPLPNGAPPGFWKICKVDLFCYSIMLMSTSIIWLSVISPENPDAILKYWDGPNYIYVGITLYRGKEETNPWNLVFNYPTYYIACHLPGYPLVIRFCAFFTLDNFVAATYLSILLSSFLLVYSFRRLLIAYNCVVNPTFTTVLLAFIPSRLVIYHSVCASEPIFVACTCLAFTLYKTANYRCMLLAVWYCCITRIEGMAVGAAIGAAFLLKFDILHAAMMFLTFIPDCVLLYVHKILFGEWFAYFKFNMQRQGIISWPPLKRLFYSAEDQNQMMLYSFVAFYFIYVISVVMVLPSNGVAGIFGCIFALYGALLNHIDNYRYGIPGTVFGFLIGFDRFWSSKNGYNALRLILIPYAVMLCFYGKGQIETNSCSDDFLRRVLDHGKIISQKIVY